MINTRYRLVKGKEFQNFYVDEQITENEIIVKPTYLSICVADQRYYQGSRPIEILKKKLPMSLIHEAVGIVLYDPKNEIKKNSKVVLVPLIDDYPNDNCKSNYNPKNKFRSSSTDGYTQSVCVVNRNDIVQFDKTDEKVASLTELLSVAINSFDNLKHILNSDKNYRIGIWGSGSLGYIVALLLEKKYKNIDVVMFGKNDSQLQYFTFVKEKYTIDEDLSKVYIDHAIECVGGSNSSNAINQIIDLIKPQGIISLLGVSENYVDINTRMVLEKGLSLYGSSRSNKNDFEEAVKTLEENPEICEYLKTLISEEIVVNNIDDLNKAFNNDVNNRFKTIMKWEL